MIGQRRRRPKHGRDPVQQRRVALKQRQELHAGRLTGQEGVEPVEHRVGLRLARKGGEDARQHLGQQIAGARRTHGAHMPGLPAAHRDHDALRIAEAERTQRRDGGGRRRVHAAEVQFRGG
jgi:hypothetical protein